MPDDTDPRQKRMLVIGFGSPAGAEWIRAFATRMDAMPAYWIGSGQGQQSWLQALREREPDLPVQTKQEAGRYRFPRQIDRSRWPRVDAAAVSELAPFWPNLYPVFLRNARRNHGMDQQNEYFAAITAWYHLFETVAPDVVVFDNIPATMAATALYYLCESRGIPKLVVLRNFQYGKKLLLMDRLEDGPTALAEEYHSLIESGEYRWIEPSRDVDAYLERMAGDYENAVYPAFRKWYGVTRGGSRLKIRDTIPRKIVDAVTGRSKRVRKAATKWEILSLPRRWRLRRRYESLQVEPDLEQSYVFVTLHNQPESTSVPMGGLFGYQLLMIDILSRALPEGWLLYVKEHPAQLYSRPVSRKFRCPTFYDDIVAYHNVRLVPALYASPELTQNARAVASANGSVCWEAVHRGVPSLVFGHAWFRHCEGVFHTPDFARAREALQRIAEGYRVDRDKLRAYVHVLDRHSLPSPGPRMLEKAREEGASDEIGLLLDRLPSTLRKAIVPR